MQFVKEGGQRSCLEARFYPTSLMASRDSRPRDPHYNSLRVLLLILDFKAKIKEF
jgi:hypothetical protein